ncbi:unnamed protein product, partial [Ectocarpus sp. 12 AP-2014]
KEGEEAKQLRLERELRHAMAEDSAGPGAVCGGSVKGDGRSIPKDTAVDEDGYEPVIMNSEWASARGSPVDLDLLPQSANPTVAPVGGEQPSSSRGGTAAAATQQGSRAGSGDGNPPTARQPEVAPEEAVVEE